MGIYFLNSRSTDFSYGTILSRLFQLIQFSGRFLVFHLHGSPKYLLDQGREEEAVEVVQSVAKHNGRLHL